MSIFLLIVGINGIVATTTVATGYDNTLTNINGRNILSNKMVAAMNATTSGAYRMIAASELGSDKDRLKELYEEIGTAIDGFYDLVDGYQNNIDSDKTLPNDTRQTLQGYHDATLSDVDELDEIMANVYEACLNGDSEKKNADIQELLSAIDQCKADISNMVDIAEKRIDEAVVKNKTAVQFSTITSIIILIIALVLGIFAASFIASAITGPMKKVTDAVKLVSNGDFNADTRTNLTNEIGQISNGVAYLTDTLKEIFEEMHLAFKAMSDGKLDVRIAADHYHGTYAQIANDINDILTSVGNDYNIIIESINEYANGNFAYTVPRFAGQKAMLHEAMDFMEHQFETIVATVDDYVTEIDKGNLELSADTSVFSGDWKKIILGFDEFASVVTKAVKGTLNSINHIARADFSYRTNASDFQGEFREMIEQINKTSASISDYVKEISETLTKMAHQDLDVYIDRDYIGDFGQIKVSLDLIINNFNKLIEEIMLSSDQVAIGSNSIANSSTNLAQGASQQASAVEELTATIGTIADATAKNIELVLKSNDIAMQAQESVERVRREMGDLLDSMREINESSNNISAVLQVIDDIAFQTNILALNAAVEAARAGEQGKGFAIVAEEVRNLAARSQEAAKNSSELIEVSVEKAEHGSLIADRTAETINAVTAQIEEISKISTNVADIYKEQNKSINEINIGIKQVSEVVSSNTATSEESAAASEELASQSAVFKEMVARFKLKNQKTKRRY